MKLVKILLAQLVLTAVWAADVTIICLHPGPAAHFADFTKVLDKEKISYQVIAAEKGAEELKRRNIQFIEFTSTALLKDLPPTEAKAAAEKILKLCQGTRKILIDVGNPFAATVLQNLKDSSVERIAYYDNPESLVEGGYSSTAALIIPKVQKIFFANKNLAKTTLYEQKHMPISYKARAFGIGYCDMADIENMAQLHAKRDKNSHEKLLVYVGGANDKYYTGGISTFLKLLTEACQKRDLSNYHFVIRQHGRAIQEGNIDGLLIKDWQKWAPKTAPRITFSDIKEPFNEVVAKADVVAYYQTSASPKFVLAGIPIMQVGPGLIEDTAVDAGASPHVETVEAFLSELQRLSNDYNYVESLKEKVRARIGYDANWPQNLLQALAD